MYFNRHNMQCIFFICADYTSFIVSGVTSEFVGALNEEWEIFVAKGTGKQVDDAVSFLLGIQNVEVRQHDKVLGGDYHQIAVRLEDELGGFENARPRWVSSISEEVKKVLGESSFDIN